MPQPVKCLAVGRTALAVSHHYSFVNSCHLNDIGIEQTSLDARQYASQPVPGKQEPCQSHAAFLVFCVSMRRSPASRSTLSQQRFATSPSRKPDVAPSRTAPRQSPCADSTNLTDSWSVKGSRPPDFALLSLRGSTAATGLIGTKPNLCATSKGTLNMLLIALHV